MFVPNNIQVKLLVLNTNKPCSQPPPINNDLPLEMVISRLRWVFLMLPRLRWVVLCLYWVFLRLPWLH